MKQKQKFFRGHRVKVAKDLGPHMTHFDNDCEAIVIGSYSDQFGGNNTDSFSLLLLTERPYTCSWYEKNQLTLINSDRDEGEEILQKYKDV